MLGTGILDICALKFYERVKTKKEAQLRSSIVDICALKFYERVKT